MTDLAADLAPLHAACNRRHSPELPCWVGRLVRSHLVAVLAEYGDKCVHCRRDGCDSVEHVHPRSRWGNDDLSNLRPSHVGCNARRGVAPLLHWNPHVEAVTHSPTVTRLLEWPNH